MESLTGVFLSALLAATILPFSLELDSDRFLHRWWQRSRYAVAGC